MNVYTQPRYTKPCIESSDELHIASLILHIKPQHRSATLAWLEHNSACTLYEDENKAAVVIVLEVDEQHTINTFMDELNASKGVLSVNLVYHHCDSASTLNQELYP